MNRSEMFAGGEPQNAGDINLDDRVAKRGFKNGVSGWWIWHFLFKGKKFFIPD